MYIASSLTAELLAHQSLRSSVTSVLGHFDPRTEVHIHFVLRSVRALVSSVLGQFGPWSVRSSVSLVLASVSSVLVENKEYLDKIK